MTAQQKTDPTTDKLIEMLKENTGRHFLDSGGAYGRHWEQNQAVDFEKEPEGQVEFCNLKGETDIVATVNVCHFLKERLEYNPELDERYRQYVEREDLYLDLPSAEAFVDTLDSPKGIYGDGEPLTVNTYNGEDLLSQIIQYVFWTDDDGAHILLQVHGGCDARGGYSTPVAFDLTDYDGTSIFNNARGTIYCDDCGKHWDTDDSCHWYFEGYCGPGHMELQDYPATDEKPIIPRNLIPINPPF